MSRRRSKKKVFTKKDYQSDQGMVTTVWGPALWHVLHTISFNYPTKPTPQQKRDYKNFFLSWEKVLPCRYCRENFPKNCKQAGLCDEVFKNRNSFSKFIYKLHCKVTKGLGKYTSEDCDSYKEVKQRYEFFRARCSKKAPKKSSRKPKKEKGCVDPLNGKRLKCVIDVVPHTSKKKSFKVCAKYTN